MLKTRKEGEPPRKEEEHPVLAEKHIKKIVIDLDEDCVKCELRGLKTDVTKNTVTVKGKTKLDTFGIEEAEWKMTCTPENAETFKMEMSVSKARLGRGRFQYLIWGKKVSAHDGKVFVSAEIDKGDVASLADRIEFDKNGFLNVNQIGKVVDSAYAGVKIGEDSKVELKDLRILGKQ